MTTGYFLSVDILGFSAINKNLTGENLKQRIENWINLVNKVAKEYSIKNYRLVSDTVFVAERDSIEGLNNLINFSKKLLLEGIQKSFPLRGAISHGNYFWDETIIYGDAMVSSIELEKNQQWIGITCIRNLFKIEEVWDHDHLICYQSPLKSGVVFPLGVVAWSVPEFNDLLDFAARGGLVRGKDEVEWKFMNIMENTIVFKMYKSLIKKKKLGPSEFHSNYSSLEVIDHTLNESDDKNEDNLTHNSG